MPKDRSCEATIYPFVGRAQAAALGAPSANIFWIFPKRMNAEERGAGSPEVPLPKRQRFRE